MIETLNGIKETVNYEQIKGFIIFDNTDYEPHPDHWHTVPEIILPLKNSYEITCKNKVHLLQEHCTESLSVDDAANQSGFSSLSSFIRMFKIVKECTPTEYRNMNWD